MPQGESGRHRQHHGPARVKKPWAPARRNRRVHGLNCRCIGRLVVGYRTLLAEPIVQIGRVGEHRAESGLLQSPHREARGFLPALHRADVAIQVRRDLFPGIEPQSTLASSAR